MKIDLPVIIKVDDYHEFGYIQDILVQFGVDIDYKELEKDESIYHKAIFYEKKNKKSLEKFEKNKAKRERLKK